VKPNILALKDRGWLITAKKPMTSSMRASRPRSRFRTMSIP